MVAPDAIRLNRPTVEKIPVTGPAPFRLMVSAAIVHVMTTAIEIVAAIIAGLEARDGEVTAAIHARMGLAVPELDVVRKPELAGVVEASSVASLRAVADSLRAGEPPREMPPPTIAEAQACARLGVPLNDLLQTYRIAHEELWDAAITGVEAVSEASAEDRAEALRLFARVFYAYLDLASVQLSEAYRLAAASDGEERRTEAVRAVLEGRADRLLGVDYELGQDQWALVAWGAGAQDAAEAAATLAPNLTLVVADELVWAWLGSEITAEAIDLALPEGTRMAVGSGGPGVKGFRLAHWQAQRAHAVAVRTNARMALYPDVAVEVLALELGDRAERFVVAELALLGDDAHSPRLRRTLEAYLANGQNATAAAASLDESDRTTAYRVRSAEERLGVPVRARAAELSLALRWERFLRGGE